MSIIRYNKVSVKKITRGVNNINSVNIIGFDITNPKMCVIF